MSNLLDRIQAVCHQLRDIAAKGLQTPTLPLRDSATLPGLRSPQQRASGAA